METYWCTIIKRKTKGQTFPTRLVRNGKTYVKQHANRFNEHFISVGPSLAELVMDTNIDPTSYIKKSSSSILLCHQ